MYGDITTEDNIYGLKPYGFREELALPHPVRETRMNKREIIDNCARIIRQAERFIEFAKQIPEDNDQEHADRVNQFAEEIVSVTIRLLEADRLRWSE